MAALMRHGVFKTVRIKPSTNAAAASFATKAEKKKGIDKKSPPRIESTAQAIAAKGFLRSQRAYSPPPDLSEKFARICNETVGAAAEIGDLNQKFNLFHVCAKEFDHAVPNSLLHSIQTIDELKKFYETPVSTITPLDNMKSMDLPENLHVQYEYHRFHPETDTMFNGQTAFNRSSTLVTGLKYKDKYKGHVQNQTWPYNS